MKLKGNRTFTVAGLLAVIGMLQTMPEVRMFIADWVPMKYHSTVNLLFAAAAMIQMRLITSTPPFKSDEGE